MIVTCNHCCQLFQIPHSGQFACPSCNGVYRFSTAGKKLQNPPTSTEASDLNGSLASLIWVFVFSIRDVLFYPNYFFSHIHQLSKKTLILTGMTTYFIGSTFDLIYSELFWKIVSPHLTQFPGLNDMFLFSNSLHTETNILMFLSTPLSFLVIVSMLAFIYTQATLVFENNAKISFSTLFPVIAVAFGSAHLFNCIPFLGSIITVFWFIGIATTGLHISAPISYGKASFIILSPYILLLMISILMMILFIAIGF